MQGTKAEQMLISIPLSAVRLVECRAASLQESRLMLTLHLGKVSAILQAVCAGCARNR